MCPHTRILNRWCSVSPPTHVAASPSEPIGTNSSAPGAAPAAAPASAAAAVVGQYVHRAELAAMRAVLVDDLARFRGLLLLLVLLGSGGLYLAYPLLKSMFVTQTSDVAAQLLDAKDVQAKASVLAKAVVHETLTDEDIAAKAQSFIHAVLSSDDTKGQVRALTDGVVSWVLSDPGVRAQLVVLAVWLLQQPHVQAALVELTQRTVSDPTLRDAVAAAGMAVLQQEAVKGQVLLWLRGLLADDDLRRQGGDYLYAAYKFSVIPSFFSRGAKAAAPHASADEVKPVEVALDLPRLHVHVPELLVDVPRPQVPAELPSASELEDQVEQVPPPAATVPEPAALEVATNATTSRYADMMAVHATVQLRPGSGSSAIEPQP